ncbi:MAG: M23 family metallopeptidase [Firmicutes bacterium]|nr:M23 family metallopeptidase [Bacillota bacterium]
MTIAKEVRTMGSLNDYGRGDGYHKDRNWRVRGRLLRQCAFAVLFFCAVAGLIDNDGPLGEAARYVAGPGLAAESSWLATDGGLLAAEAKPGGAENSGHSGTADGTAEANAADAAPDPAEKADDPAQDDAATPKFTAPASGVVVSDLAAAATDANQRGILIQGSAGQKVRAAAAGTVQELRSENGLYRLEIAHSGGFTSVYQGLSQIDVALGDPVSLGDPVGACAGGQLTFSLLQQGQAVDPLDYLFN